MVWSEYVNETVWEDENLNDDDYHDSESPLSTRINCEDWTTWHSENLLNMWFTLRSHRDYAPYLWQLATYTNFSEFCYVYSYGDDEYTHQLESTTNAFELGSDDINRAWIDIRGFSDGLLEYATLRNFYDYSRRYSK